MIRSLTKRQRAAIAACVALSTSVLADQVILIGGGDNVHDSQPQIEYNVRWVQGVLQATPASVRTFFTDGDDPAADIHYVVHGDDSESALAPLARVFGDVGVDRRRYRNHELTDISGGTQRDTLKPALQHLLGSDNAEDTLLVFNGHGTRRSSTTDQVSLSLWNNTAMTPAELHSLLGNNRAPFRFVFTQCYSGGFHRIAYANPKDGARLTNAKRCGFTAESAYRAAEGCSASIDSSDYRDYSTYFFAALSGYDRNGEILGQDPDTDADGVTSLREAHLYTLEKALSADLPNGCQVFAICRTTSMHVCFATSLCNTMCHWIPA